ncbi:isoprenylcysteine carboxylmethyltransferase family protein [Paracoccus sp. PAR01]|uniref:methyltransferase family protein n=1 Tax=Paracoccus sp. PAR01 TaxID=2769282 RepID=UPI00177DAADA|nr:isoprenylcysteine carboxylmethyltransferase family protein [Paracoccus sp. PAR01]MBD9528618.1 isoprenylcysteine carboxylmethyltransferase family protein [Paracoccus sp. PAR01]
MSLIVDNIPSVAPANQRLRLNVLRLAFVAALLPMLWGYTRWAEGPAAILHLAGTLCVFAAVLGRFWAILYIGGRKNADVMRDGPYSLCRHPLYLFSTLGVVGFGLLLQSLTLAIGFGGAALLVLSQTARAEERFLRGKFGEAYAEYQSQVPMILPRLSGFHTRREVTFRTDTLRRNLFDALVFLTALPLAEVINWLHSNGHMLKIALF